jgi:site-specific recombinase
MPTVDLFRQYAEDALRQAVQYKNEKEQLALIELVRTWTQAAEVTSDSAMVFNYSPPGAPSADIRRVPAEGGGMP